MKQYYLLFQNESTNDKRSQINCIIIYSYTYTIYTYTTSLIIMNSTIHTKQKLLFNGLAANNSDHHQKTFSCWPTKFRWSLIYFIQYKLVFRLELMWGLHFENTQVFDWFHRPWVMTLNNIPKKVSTSNIKLELWV